MESQIITPPPVVGVNFKLFGEVEVLHRKHLQGVEETIYKGPNTIHANLKAKFRDIMNANSDFALNNKFLVDEEDGFSGANSGKDGILLDTDQGTRGATMIFSDHSDASGSYYRQWAGVYTNDFGSGTHIMSGARMGWVLDETVTYSVGTNFTVVYADTTFSAVSLLANDILTINWKVSVTS